MPKKNWVDTSKIPQMEPLQADSRSLSEGFHRYLRNHLGHFLSCVPYYIYEAMSLTIRDRIMARWRTKASIANEAGDLSGGQCCFLLSPAH